jgi:hypothetical protein
MLAASDSHAAPKPPTRSTTSPKMGGHTVTPSEEIASPSPTAVPAARTPASSAMSVCCTPFQPTPKKPMPPASGTSRQGPAPGAVVDSSSAQAMEPRP